MLTSHEKTLFAVVRPHYVKFSGTHVFVLTCLLLHAAAKLWGTRRIDVTMVHRPLDPCPASGVHCFFGPRSSVLSVVGPRSSVVPFRH